MEKVHKRCVRLLCCACVTAAAASAAPGPSAPVRLRVEYMEEPLGVDVEHPLRFTWTAAHSQRHQAQSAYQLTVVMADSAPGGATAATVWDSGKVQSNVSQNVPLGASAKLGADTAYGWSVRWWDTAGVSSPTSSSSFSTGLFTEGDCSHGPFRHSDTT